ncbi:MAG: hypothetical protein FJX62_16825 [Alphaproteobacteria bacterium]|nr:hypothetical protein [Alphaproteobacteria bacterium]
MLRILVASAAICMAGGALAQERPERPRPIQAAPKPPAACPTIHRPVCGWDKNGKELNYDNECLARAAGAVRTYSGLCIADITF